MHLRVILGYHLKLNSWFLQPVIQFESILENINKKLHVYTIKKMNYIHTCYVYSKLSLCQISRETKKNLRYRKIRDIAFLLCNSTFKAVAI